MVLPGFPFWELGNYAKVDFGVSVNLFLELLLMLLVLVSHDVQNGISCDFDFVRWSLHFEFPSYTSTTRYLHQPHPP